MYEKWVKPLEDEYNWWIGGGPAFKIKLEDLKKSQQCKVLEYTVKQDYMKNTCWESQWYPGSQNGLFFALEVL